ncbi:MAG: hypothetical protein IT353_02830 [Gemmatimonadaceae bacterium]|nr:hypothetical protein [Gemmatimonadaceae bacterium]
MVKLLQLSFLIMAVAVPLLAAGDRSPVRGIRRTMALFFVGTVAYALLITMVLPRFA